LPAQAVAPVLERQRPAAKRLVLDQAALVVAHARLVVGEEDHPDRVAPAAHARLVERALEVLLDGVCRDHQALGDLRRRVALQDQPRVRDLAF
jgi:hypothetical protein